MALPDGIRDFFFLLFLLLLFLTPGYEATTPVDLNVSRHLNISPWSTHINNMAIGSIQLWLNSPLSGPFTCHFNVLHMATKEYRCVRLPAAIRASFQLAGVPFQLWLTWTSPHPRVSDRRLHSGHRGAHVRRWWLRVQNVREALAAWWWGSVVWLNQTTVFAALTSHNLK